MMKEKGKRNEGARQHRRIRGPIMTFKRREKELWNAKLSGGFCGTCRTLHDGDQQCNMEYINKIKASEITHNHKRQIKSITSGVIYWQKDGIEPDSENNQEDSEN